MKLIKNIKLLIPDVLPPGSPAEKFSSLILITLYIFLVLRGELLGTSSATILFAVFSVFMLLLLLLSDKVRAPKFIFLPILAFSLTLIASVVTSQVPEESFKKIFIYLASFIFFFVSYSLSHKYKKFLVWFLNIIFIFGLYVVLRFFINDTLAQNLQAGGKFIGPFYWHNQMAGFLLYLIPLPLVSLLLNRKKQTLVWLVVLIFFIITLVFTLSRGAWISLILPVIAGVFFFRKKIKINRLTKFSVIIALIIGIIVFVNSDTTFNRVKSIAREILPNTRTTSGNLRAGIYPSSIEAIRDYPLLGVGPGVFGQALHKYQSRAWLYAANAHNHFLQIAVETGILGFLLFSLIFIQAGRITFKYRDSFLKKTGEQPVYLLALIISLSASIIHNLLDIDWNLPSLSYLFWVTLGALLGNLVINKKDVILINKSYKGLIVILMFIYSLFIFGLFSFNKQLESGKFFFLRREFDKSLSSFAKIDKAFPYSYNSSIYTAKIYQERKDYQNALLYLKRASELNPFLAETDYSQGIIYSNLGQVALAEESFRAAIEKNPFSSPDYYKTLADLYVLGGENEKALEILAQAVNVAFPVNTSYKNLSYIYQVTGFDRRLAHIYLSYAQLLASNGDFKKANQIVEIALIELEPENVKLKNLKSYIQEEL